MQRSRTFLKLIFALAGLLVILLALEIIFRTLPVNEGLHTMPVNDQNPILRFEPNRTSLWSRHWNCTPRNRVRTNNYGFINDIDYVPEADKPLLALIGDSYVEAAMVPWKETAAGRLSQSLKGAARVYSFGASGSALSQYLAYAEYAKNQFHPSALIIVVIGNDFDESLTAYKDDPGFHYFERRHDGSGMLIRRNFSPGLATKLVRSSALAMYIATNLKLPERDKPIIGNTWSEASPERLRDSQWAIDSFFSMLPAKSGLPASKILFVLDGIRPFLYNEQGMRQAAGSFEEIMRRYFIQKANSGQYEVLDLQEKFRKHYAQHHRKFEFENDLHWNSLGHEIFADALMETTFLKDLLTTTVESRRE